ncbi:MAG: hypothetical protein FGM33_03600 [Candidatus Kapabacteria bacterium]|nr:hypothetical protein [Candidatus Kapabacteria bacterium]
MQILALALLFAAGSAVGLAQRTVGLISQDASRSFKGYTLFAPVVSRNTYLIDNEGQVVKTWQSTNNAGQAAMLLDDGSLLRTAAPPSQWMQGGGAGGMVELYDWSGAKVWSYTHLSQTARSHHDVEILPNGNILLLVWESHTIDEAVAAGRPRSRLIENALWSERVIEVRRTGPTTGEVVWSWSSWDHMIQDANPAGPNFGVVSQNANRVDINAGDTRADWLHANSVRYNAKRDEVMISLHNLDEIWIISRKTGDIVYRYGNPQNYKSGTPQNQVLFGQHDARWLDDDRFVMIFNNGNGRFGGNGSSVDVIELPRNEDGTYRRNSKGAFEPAAPTVLFPKKISTSYYAQNISGATMLPNGNVLTCLGPSGTFVEATPEGDEVWRYVSPVIMNGIATQGQTPRNNMVFKIYRYGPDHPAVAGRTLTPRGRLEDGPLSVSTSDDGKGLTCQLDVLQSRLVITADTDRHVTIDAYDLQGRLLGRVANEDLAAGTHVRSVPPGTYVVSMR